MKREILKVRCDNGHWYDGNKYEVCPHCLSLKAQPKEKKKIADDIDKTTSIWGNPDESISGTLQESPKESDLPSTMPLLSQEEIEEERDLPAETIRPIPDIAESQAPVKSDLVEQVLSSSPDLGKTKAYYDVGQVEPVVGWLVAVKGIYFGESFSLKTGKNFIGRSNTMDVRLSEDLSISREKHATIIYEPKKREFYLQPGEGSGLTYLNGSMLLQPEKLESYAQVELGDSKFFFIAFCGDSFVWDDYITKEQGGERNDTMQ